MMNSTKKKKLKAKSSICPSCKKTVGPNHTVRISTEPTGKIIYGPCKEIE